MTTDLKKQFFDAFGIEPTNLFVEYLKHYFQKLKQQAQALFKE